jgi:Fur family ferric uptake transcriptional regulator
MKMAHLKRENIEKVLREHGLKATPQRIDVLKVFMERSKVMNWEILNKYLGKDFDRVTLYRTLQSFEERGLIHKIPDKDMPGYALCQHDTVNHSHEDNHVHFKCTNCALIVCLEDIEIPVVKVPRKFKPEKYNFLIEGICEDCSPKK